MGLVTTLSALTSNPPWIARPQVTVQFLPAFSQREGASLIGEVVGGRVLPKIVVDRILVHADGVPLFIEELTKAVLDKGLSHEGDGNLLAIRAALAWTLFLLRCKPR